MKPKANRAMFVAIFVIIGGLIAFFAIQKYIADNQLKKDMQEPGKRLTLLPVYDVWIWRTPKYYKVLGGEEHSFVDSPKVYYKKIMFYGIKEKHEHYGTKYGMVLYDGDLVYIDTIYITKLDGDAYREHVKTYKNKR